MAKKKEKKEQQAIEPVANSDQFTEEVAICDLQNTDIAAMIQVVRGQPILLDRDLAILYNVKNKRLKELKSKLIETSKGFLKISCSN